MAKKSMITRIADVDLKLLSVFQTVVSCGGFTAAEFELNLSRSTISKHIADLETRLDLRLCHRGPAGFSITSDGSHVLDAAEELFLAIDRFQTRLGEARSQMTGKLRIACFDRMTSNPSSRVFDAIGQFHDKAPGVTLDISMEPSNVIEEGVINGKFNFGIVPLHRKSGMLDYYKLYSEDMRLYCGRDHPLFGGRAPRHSIEDLRQYEYVGLNFNSPNMEILQRLKLHRSALVQDEEAVTLLVLSGRYLGFLPTQIAVPFEQGGLMDEVKNNVANYQPTMAAIVRKSGSTGRRLKLFLECILDAHG